MPVRNFAANMLIEIDVTDLAKPNRETPVTRDDMDGGRFNLIKSMPDASTKRFRYKMHVRRRPSLGAIINRRRSIVFSSASVFRDTSRARVFISEFRFACCSPCQARTTIVS